jgi:KaiC/GvpD/RAD55 family RecA-like ATPase
MAFVDGLEIVPDDSVLCIEENNGNVKSIYALYIASERAREGKPVTYLTLQSCDTVLKTMARLNMKPSDLIHIIELPPDRARQDVLTRVQEPDCHLLIIDPFSVIFAEDSFLDLSIMLAGLVSASRKGTTFLLLVDAGIMNKRQENLVRAMSDGVIQFVVVPEGDKLKYYISTPKMRGAFPQEKMLPFTISNEGLLIDTRERHG